MDTWFDGLVAIASQWEDERGDGNAVPRWVMVELLDTMRDCVRAIQDDMEL